MNTCGHPPQEARRVAEYRGKYEEIRGNARKIRGNTRKYEKTNPIVNQMEDNDEKRGGKYGEMREKRFGIHEKCFGIQ